MVTNNYNDIVDILYGLICSTCFLVGTIGNIISFLCFLSKKREISTLIYTLTSANDFLISLCVLPVGVCFFRSRQSGFIFNITQISMVWWYVWEVAVLLSIFFVICLSITRTLSLVRPFMIQNTKYLLTSILLYLTLQLAVLIGLHNLNGATITFSPRMSRSILTFHDVSPESDPGNPTWYLLEASTNVTYVAPALVVAVSCTISAVSLTKRNRRVRKMQRKVLENQNRATVTILLFAMVYGVCNLPLLFMYIFQTYAVISNNWSWFRRLNSFDTQGYYSNFIFTLLIAINSAANPALYFWRMPSLRHYTISRANRMLRVNRNISRPIRVTELRNDSRTRTTSGYVGEDNVQTAGPSVTSRETML